LVAHSLEHSKSAFRRWVEQEYCPGPARARLELLEVPERVPRKRPWVVQLRAHNTSVETWHLRPGATAGVHCGYLLTDASGETVMRGRSGMFFADVTPGQSIDLTLTLPSIDRAGTYYLMVDMLEEAQQSWFYQHGSTPLLQEIHVGLGTEF